MRRTTIALAVLTTTWSAAAAEPHGASNDAAREDTRDLSEEDGRGERDTGHSATRAAASGALSTFSVAPGVPRAANGLVLGGYDSAANAFRARGAADGRILSFLAARVEFEHGPSNGPSNRVALGLRAQFLNQAAHGIDLGAMVFYQPNDFREEGNVVAGLLFARSFDRLTLVLNPLVGSDPEGDDQSFELRVAGLYRTGSSLVVGIDSRSRYNLSSDIKRAGFQTIDWETQAGASAAFGVGPVLISALVGPSLLQRTDVAADGTSGDPHVRAGLLAMAGAGASF
jgi:hypothetical protein